MVVVGCGLGFGALQFPLGRAGWGSKRRMLCVGLLVTWGGLARRPPRRGGGGLDDTYLLATLVGPHFVIHRRFWMVPPFHLTPRSS